MKSNTYFNTKFVPVILSFVLLKKVTAWFSAKLELAKAECPVMNR